ncbi:Adenosine (5')-pentaphospho-(5'')-adenosine pyrophosphohydrolase [Candidatus Phaeomarinobacter ectocarpi]|uniref:RNA pyrophosphohydrolase n=1 Tax=Candidatus Phaeomarinibacter ectocarpi TaxID=1458461 RepID=X5MMR1_9HYPH|nr:RNA pyrophosphohydrolase [Candidatus Phaeomarinobacter ectocarpi]CDO59456.1 Adenosine (5')-pentaphospho-(5'')-adenosine pyrophosphohydrolase [Candidatus Phaeomarinobacter ectocarpi]
MSKLPYRPCVGIMLLNASNKVWIGRRAMKRSVQQDEPGSWQMPQGGIDEGEDPLPAALRELEEETGISDVEVIGQTENWLTYDLPEHLVGKALKGKYCGQKQKWFAMRYLGNDSAIDLSKAEDDEFDDWRWEDAAQLPGLIVEFKRPVYEQVVEHFAHLTA